MLTSIVTKTDVMTRSFFMKHFKHLTKYDCEEPDKDIAGHFYYELYIGSLFYNAFLHNMASE